MVLLCNTSPTATSIHSPPHTTISALISAWWLRVAPKACISSSQKCHCVTFPPFAFGPRAGPFSNSSALQIPRIYSPSFSSSSLPVWRKDLEASWPGLFRAHLLVASSLLLPQGKRGEGCVCPTQPYGYRSLTPAPLELPSPSGGFPPKGQARPMNSRQDMSLAVTRGTPRPTPSRRRPRCTATFWACLGMVSHAASVAGKLLGHCPAPCMRHFSCWPWPSRSGSQRGHAGTWRNFGGRLQWRPGCRLCSLPSHVALAQQPSAPCTRPGPSSQVRRARSFVLTRSIPPPSSSLNPEAHLI